ncbi:MAG: aldo/keto reductase [Candidatus Dormibacteria bacterium]
MALEIRPLGSRGPSVSVLALGTNSFGTRMADEEVPRVVGAALDQGVTLFDTADIYGGGESERLLGQALGARRGEALVTTKFGMRRRGDDPELARGDPAYVLASAEASLRRLGTDVIDVYLMHQPDPKTPIEETLGALQQLISAGKVRFVGCSNFDAAGLVAAREAAKAQGLDGFVCSQDNYSLLERGAEEELFPTLERLGLGLMAYFPLAQGLLSGKYRRGQPPPPGSRLGRGGGAPVLGDAQVFDRIERLRAFAKERGLSLLQVALGGLLAQPLVRTVVAGATRPEQVLANAAACRWRPGPEELRQLEAASR